LITASALAARHLGLIDAYTTMKLYWYSGAWSLMAIFVSWPKMITGLELPQWAFDIALFILLPIVYGTLLSYGSKGLARATIVICIALLNFLFFYVGFGAMN